MPGPIVVPTLPALPVPVPNSTPSCLQSLDITKRKLVHEGPLTWRVTKDKSVGERQGGEGAVWGGTQVGGC